MSLARAGGSLVLRGAETVTLTVRAEGCRGLRKVSGSLERALAKMRGLAEKEAGIFGRDAWQGRSRAGEEAGGATGCGGSRAWGRVGLALRGLASMCTVRRCVPMMLLINVRS